MAGGAKDTCTQAVLPFMRTSSCIDIFPTRERRRSIQNPCRTPTSRRQRRRRGDPCRPTTRQLSFPITNHGSRSTEVERNGRPTIVTRVTFPICLLVSQKRDRCSKPWSVEFQTTLGNPKGFQLPTMWDVSPPSNHNPGDVRTG